MAITSIGTLAMGTLVMGTPAAGTFAVRTLVMGTFTRTGPALAGVGRDRVFLLFKGTKKASQIRLATVCFLPSSSNRDRFCCERARQLAFLSVDWEDR